MCSSDKIATPNQGKTLQEIVKQVEAGDYQFNTEIISFGELLKTHVNMNENRYAGKVIVFAETRLENKYQIPSQSC